MSGTPDRERLIRDGIEAFRMTREYVGEDTLPAIEGWSWFDWCEKAREYLAAGVHPAAPSLDVEALGEAMHRQHDDYRCGGPEWHSADAAALAREYQRITGR